MRPALLLQLFSSVVLLVNAIPIPVRPLTSSAPTILIDGLSLQAETSELTNTDDSDNFEVDPAGVDRRDLDEASGTHRTYVQGSFVFLDGRP